MTDDRQKASGDASSSDDDVIFVREVLPSKEKQDLARKYLLPPSFYLYENKPPCPGCIGCDDWEEKKAQLKLKKEEAKKTEEKPKVEKVESGMCICLYICKC